MTQLSSIRARRWAIAGLALGLPVTGIAILPFPAVAVTYQVRSLPGDVADPDWLAAAPLQTIAATAAAGASETIAISGLAAGTQTLLVRA